MPCLSEFYLKILDNFIENAYEGILLGQAEGKRSAFTWFTLH